MTEPSPLRVAFEHLVEINDAASLVHATITREQLWQGLVLRAEEPTLFVPTLSEARIVSRTEHGLVRALRFGEHPITDEVTFDPLREVRYDIAAQGEIPRSVLRMRIEEPRPGALFVRFVYEDARPPEEDDATLDELRRGAYEQADIDTIGMIRYLIETGRLERAS